MPTGCYPCLSYKRPYLPRYDYVCKECNHQFEVRQSFTSEPVAACPVCDNEGRRVIHSVPVVFKGSGFYVNDYGKGKGSTTSTPDTKSETSRDKDGAGSDPKSESTDSTSDSTSDSKPDKEPTSSKQD